MVTDFIYTKCYNRLKENKGIQYDCAFIDFTAQLLCYYPQL